MYLITMHTYSHIMTHPESVEIGKNCNIGKDVSLGENVTIRDNVTLTGYVSIGAETIVDTGCIIEGVVNIGERNHFYPYCLIGGIPMVSAYEPPSRVHPGSVEIGNDNIFRDFTTVHRPIERRRTRIGNDCYLLAYAHVGHDAWLHGDIHMGLRSTASGFARIHEHCAIGDDVYIGYGITVHEYSLIMAGLKIEADVLHCSEITRDGFASIANTVMNMHGFSDAKIAEVEAYYRRGTEPEDSDIVDRIKHARSHSSKAYQPTFSIRDIV